MTEPAPRHMPPDVGRAVRIALLCIALMAVNIFALTYDVREEPAALGALRLTVTIFIVWDVLREPLAAYVRRIRGSRG